MPEDEILQAMKMPLARMCWLANTLAQPCEGDMHYERGPVVSSGPVVDSSGLEGKAGAAEYEIGHKNASQNGRAIPAGVQTGVKGVDVKQGEIIDQKYYTGLENRPQEQALGRQPSYEMLMTTFNCLSWPNM